jgi:hypothetical protein
MKTFIIKSWTYTADRPNESFVEVAVVSNIGDIQQQMLYSFVIEGRYESITSEFKQLVEDKLNNANLL